MRRLVLALLAWSAAVSATAAPPPPPVYPEEWPQTLDGYSMSLLYARYSFWIESRKGTAIDSIMEKPAEVAGYRARFVPAIGFDRYDDYGHFSSGDIRSYCRLNGEGKVDQGDCLFVLRIVSIPARVLDSAGPLGRFMRDSFDPAAVVASLKANAVAPDADIWGIDGGRIFGGLPSPAAVLRDNARIELLDSRECPAMRSALEAVEGQRLPQSIDISLLGEDGAMPPPRPHAAWQKDRLTFRANGGYMTVTNSSGALDPLIGPVYDAAADCLQGRK